MKVGILTFHRAINYGAVLQAWALKTFLQNKGYEACVIDYRCKAIENNYNIFSWHKTIKKGVVALIKKTLSNFYHCRRILNRRKKFEDFLQNRLNLRAVNDVETLDTVITGSDQVWNPYLTDGMDDYYFLNIPAFSNKKKIAYAVSGEKCYFSDTYVRQISPVIAKIHKVSVRESNLIEVLNLKDATVCVDPTFLLTEKEWSCLGKERVIEKDYIFLFEVVPSPIARVIANELSNKYNIEVVFLNSGFKFLRKSSNMKIPVGPEEFVSLIRHARFVVTTSFHGMAISLLFKKQFVLAPTKHMNRQRSLLKEIGLENRIVNNLGELKLLSDIQYSDEQFVKLSKSSKDFLLSSLSYDKDSESTKVN